MMFLLKNSILFFAFSVFCADANSTVDIPAPTTELLHQRFIQSLEREQDIVVDLIAEDPAVRSSAVRRVESSSYRDHTLNYLNYYRSLPNYDLFSGIISNQDIRQIEARTQTEYVELLEQLFGRTQIDGQLFFRFFMGPEEFFRENIRSEIEIASGLDWAILFAKLRDLLPRDIPYKTQLKIDPKRPGGSYNAVKDEIVFGAYTPNISTVLGFIHEFGHSVFLIPNDDSGALRILAANESYAEIWAEKLLQFPFARAIFYPSAKATTIEKYMRFRNLLSLRFHLFVLELDREIHLRPSLKLEGYKLLSEKLSRRYLATTNFPPVLPVMPQMRKPGYLQSYLAIPFLKAAHRSKIQEGDFVKSLIELGPIVLQDASQAKFTRTLRNAVQACLNRTLPDCLD